MWAGTNAQEHVHAWTQEARAAALGALRSCVHSSEPGLSPLWTALTALPQAQTAQRKEMGGPRGRPRKKGVWGHSSSLSPDTLIRRIWQNLRAGAATSPPVLQVTSPR